MAKASLCLGAGVAA